MASLPTVCSQANVMGFLRFQDHSLGLPPCFPIGRGEDDTSTLVLTKAWPGAVTGFVPWVVLHRPRAERRYAPDAFDGIPAEVGPQMLVRMALRTLGPLPLGTSAAERWAAIGRHLFGIGSMPPSAFVAFVVHEWRTVLSHLHRVAAAAADEYPDNPGWWRDRLARSRDRIATVMRHSDRPPVPWTDPDLTEARWGMRRYGELLQAWPALLDAARSGARP